MDLTTLARQIAEGRRLTANDDLDFLIDCDLDALCRCADVVRQRFIGDKVDLCAIINGRSGRCSEDCKFCAQSSRHATKCATYAFLPEEEILETCRERERDGVERFAIVTSGKALDGDEFDRALRAFALMREKTSVSLCASMGFLTFDQLKKLKNAGVTSYHHNIETSRRFFPQICTTHTFDQKIQTLQNARAAGLRLCSGGIFGLGETWRDRIDMALTLAEIRVDSIPINALMPIQGTPLENNKRLTEQELLRIVAIFRLIVPAADIRLAAGRALMREDGKRAFCSGASATITGDMLTTAACATIKSDRRMLQELGRVVPQID
ncbi:MAG: biotin synthase BioB [Thermoguttaceae bacterium]|nr:biotin synthase BioB [Thermoguttaceae bacterium]